MTKTARYDPEKHIIAIVVKVTPENTTSEYFAKMQPALIFCEESEEISKSYPILEILPYYTELIGTDRNAKVSLKGFREKEGTSFTLDEAKKLTEETAEKYGVGNYLAMFWERGEEYWGMYLTKPAKN